MKMFQILNLYKKCFRGFFVCRYSRSFHSVFLLFSLVCSISDPDKRLQALWVVCDMLPKANKTNFRSACYYTKLLTLTCNDYCNRNKLICVREGTW